VARRRADQLRDGAARVGRHQAAGRACVAHPPGGSELGRVGLDGEDAWTRHAQTPRAGGRATTPARIAGR
jgi:hypothetical protein